MSKIYKKFKNIFGIFLTNMVMRDIIIFVILVRIYDMRA